MGFFSSISSFVSGIASGIGKICSSIGSAISSTISSIGNLATKAVSSFLGTVANKASVLLKGVSGIMAGSLGPILGPILVDLIVKLVVKVISKIAEEIGAVEKNERPEEIGYRLEEAENHGDWKQREDFNSFKEYYSYLKEQIPAEEIDKKDLKENFSTYSMLGMQAEVKAIEEKFGLQIPTDSLIAIGRSAMDFKEVQAFIRAFEELGYDNLNISEYLKGLLPAGELERITAALLDALKLYFPAKSEKDLLVRMDEMRKALADDKVLVSIYKDDLQQEYGKQLQAARQNGELPEATNKILNDIDFNISETTKNEATL